MERGKELELNSIWKKTGMIPEGKGEEELMMTVL